MVHLILGGPIIAAETLSRFFTLHVFVIPGLLIAFVGLHLCLVLKLGINEWPMPGRLVSRETYRRSTRPSSSGTACRSSGRGRARTSSSRAS